MRRPSAKTVGRVAKSSLEEVVILAVLFLLGIAGGLVSHRKAHSDVTPCVNCQARSVGGH